MTAPFAEYVLPEELGRVEAEDRLSAHLRLGPAGTEAVERTYYDTFDGRLHAAGLRLAEDDDGLAAANGVGEVARAALPRRWAGGSIVTAQLPAGGLRDLVGPIVEMRALTPVARVRSRQRSLRVLDDEAKTVVRLMLDESELAGSGARLRLDARLHVQCVRGYDQAFARVWRERARARARRGREGGRRAARRRLVEAGRLAAPRRALRPGSRDA